MTAEPRTGSRRTLWLILAVCASPMVAAFAAYYLLPSRDTTNYGKILPTRSAPELAGTALDGRAWTLSGERGHWVILVTAPAACDDACAKRLYATRQARTMQGKERERVVRVWMVPEGSPSPALLEEHPDVVVVRADPTVAARLPQGTSEIYLVDPLGNQVIAWPDDPDIRGLARDLTKLLRASRIG